MTLVVIDSDGNGHAGEVAKGEQLGDRRVDRGLVLGLDRVHDDDILSRQEGRTPSLMLGPVAPLALARAVPGLLALLA